MWPQLDRIWLPVTSPIPPDITARIYAKVLQEVLQDETSDEPWPPLHISDRFYGSLTHRAYKQYIFDARLNNGPMFSPGSRTGGTNQRAYFEKTIPILWSHTNSFYKVAESIFWGFPDFQVPVDDPVWTVGKAVWRLTRGDDKGFHRTCCGTPNSAIERAGRYPPSLDSLPADSEISTCIREAAGYLSDFACAPAAAAAAAAAEDNQRQVAREAEGQDEALESIDMYGSD